MDEFIARENIRRFEAQLKTAVDDSQRTALEDLLRDERKHLMEISRVRGRSARASSTCGVPVVHALMHNVFRNAASLTSYVIAEPWTRTAAEAGFKTSRHSVTGIGRDTGPRSTPGIGNAT